MCGIQERHPQWLLHRLQPRIRSRTRRDRNQIATEGDSAVGRLIPLPEALVATYTETRQFAERDGNRNLNQSTTPMPQSAATRPPDNPM